MYLLELVLVVALLCAAGEAADPPLPALSPYFTSYIEQSSINSAEPLNFIQDFYDEDFQIKRDDAYSQLNGTKVSVIEDIKLGVQYTINKQFNNCTIVSLYSGSGARAIRSSNIIVGPHGQIRLKSLKELFFLTENFTYTYKGNETVRDLEVDTWTTLANFTYSPGLVNFTNTRINVSFTRPDTYYPSLSSSSADPILIRHSVEGSIVTSDGNASSIYVVQHFVGSSYDQPSFDVFDVSVCSDPSDYQIGTLFIPGHIAGTDLGVMRKSIRGSISNFTGLYPIQIGSIEVLGENGTYIFVKLHISNVTTVSHVSNSVTANSAIQNLLSNSNNGLLPFTIELSPGNSVTPVFRVHNENQSCRNGSNGSTTTTTVTITVTPTPTAPTTPTTSCGTIIVTTTIPNSNCLMPSPPITCSPPVITTTTATIVDSTCATSSTSNSCPSTGTTTLTKTLTNSICPSATTSSGPTSCPSTSTVVVTTILPKSDCGNTCSTATTTVTDTKCTTTTTAPPSCQGSGNLGTGPAVGLAFGMFFAGVFVALLAVFSIFTCRRRLRRGRLNSSMGYEKQKDEVEYFQ